jgi:glycosyltransferase involved in cell wall biosynthesis
VVLDLHEAMPEFFRSRFHGRAGRVGYALLRFQERAATRFATAVLTVNEALGDRLLAIGVPASKVLVVPNAPSLRRFDPARFAARPFMADGTLRLVYAGALSPIYELDVVLEAIARLARERPELRVSLALYGRDFAEVPLHDQANSLGIGDRVAFHGRIPIESIPAAIAAADAGLAPTRRSEFTDFSLSTKAYEYAAMGRTVVASRLPMVERVFGDDAVTYTPGDAADLAAALVRLVDEPEAREARLARALERVQGLGWERVSRGYLDLVERLAAGPGATRSVD